MLIFPETALTGYDVEPGDMPAEERMHRRLAETIPGNATDRVCELTKKYDMYVIFGMAERDADDSTKVYNAADRKVLLEAAGSFIFPLRKRCGHVRAISHFYLTHPGDRSV